VNTRSCKHLKSLLGEKYEEARLKLKNPDGRPAAMGKAPASTSKKASKAKATASRKRKKEDDEDQEGEVKAEDDEPVKKKTRNAPASRTKGKTIEKQVVVDDLPVENEKMDEDEGNEDSNPFDELASISGIKPKVYLKDGAEQEVKSMSRYALLILQPLLLC
jgi:DNA ligase-1